ncbi:PspA/IM30 family protein [Heyndrickxia sporothermodurans]|uniref:PspA/IM30 family protein n=1 Tax=Heyndrickxia TaxID=2837504 RepID=UPI000D353CD9|nr:PspA/IM30 family protein [Heyndrickxia sporothermodurans]MEB6549851.1 PspA/IM30 family protein [Heyndrickxia sporothermodurans]MED3652459.1 PspA/IM30 family protein [Heyndrickxia sporothermodurans]MED3655330.1 PspA/IM30 family protein [Heyndrickxia sporothermodurans]MED3699749.1 PspA/IM30 family protein [Heyndrickxia sporothermodurans]PTY77012.1 modulator protein [Heyndrickxia sporothermodurans]
MSTLFDRIKHSVMADLHDAMETKEKKNPIGLLNQYLRDSEKEAKKIEKLIERQYLLKEEFARELKQTEFMADKRCKQAEIALEANELELHQIAIDEEAVYKTQALSLREAFNEASNQLEVLEKKHREMKMKLKDMQIKRLELMGRENVIKVTKKMNHILDDSVMGKSNRRFEETEKYIDHLEAKLNSGFNMSMFDSRISELEKGLKNKETSIK